MKQRYRLNAYNRGINCPTGLSTIIPVRAYDMYNQIMNTKVRGDHFAMVLLIYFRNEIFRWDTRSLSFR
jgi:hypothetical protein